MSEQQVELATQLDKKTTMTTKETIIYLAEKFPLCFTVEGQVKPLKVGLFQELAQATSDDEKVSKTLLRQALRSYTMGWRYLAACTTDAVRVGLNGEPAGIVDATQAEHAAQALAEAKAAYTERREQQRKEQKKAFFKKQAQEQKQKKELANKSNKLKTKAYAVSNSKPRPVKNQENLTALSIEQVNKGQKVKVKVGNSAQVATVVEIEKSSIRVQLNSGLTINVNAEHLFA